MNEFFKKWIAALRSGKYKQGYAYLHRNGRFCAIGVACDLMADKLLLDTTRRGATSYNGLENGPPPAVVRELGLQSLAFQRYYTVDGLSIINIVQANDLGLTFEQIADLAEQEWGKCSG